MSVQMRWRRSKSVDHLARTFLPALERDYQGERHAATFDEILLKQIGILLDVRRDYATDASTGRW
ncbi:MAG: hypothetical protein E6G76_01615 [Alphaproteobacteria bacterium]|jgi:hypothetical protein|nr:MAG: hypothetical protein E6G76_01615 [Alphaproteobacteria bacterium]